MLCNSSQRFRRSKRKSYAVDTAEKQNTVRHHTKPVTAKATQEANRLPRWSEEAWETSSCSGPPLKLLQRWRLFIESEPLGEGESLRSPSLIRGVLRALPCRCIDHRRMSAHSDSFSWVCRGYGVFEVFGGKCLLIYTLTNSLCFGVSHVHICGLYTGIPCSILYNCKSSFLCSILLLNSPLNYSELLQGHPLTMVVFSSAQVPFSLLGGQSPAHLTVPP